jgi:hypothetical protein
MAQKIEDSMVAKKGAITTLFSTNKTSTMPLKYIKDEDGNFVCPHPGCGFTKKNQSTLHYHMKKHEEQLDHICKTCKKQFLQKQTLDLHIRSKHPELIKDDISSEKKFKCPFDDCDFTALTKGNCVIHCLRVHFQDEINNMMTKDNETKLIYCNECNKEFSSSCAFYYHCKNCMTFDTNNIKYKKFEEISA